MKKSEHKSLIHIRTSFLTPFSLGYYDDNTQYEAMIQKDLTNAFLETKLYLTNYKPISRSIYQLEQLYSSF